MGWSKVGDGEDVIGDAPADAIGYVLIKRHERAKAKPTLKELMDAIQITLMKKGNDYLENGGGNIVSAVQYVGESNISITSQSKEDSELEADIDKVIKNIVIEYEQLLDRKPRISEILGTFAFVLSENPEKYLREAKGVSIRIGDIIAR